MGCIVVYGLWEAETIAAFAATAGRVAAARGRDETPEAPYGGAVGDAGEEIADKDVEGNPGGLAGIDLAGRAAGDGINRSRGAGDGGSAGQQPLLLTV